MTQSITITFNASEATLANAGGKGVNLSRLSRAGFPVPVGFIITTQAYHDFVADNQLKGVIQAGLENLSANEASALEAASTKMRQAFRTGAMPAPTIAAIRQEYARMNNSPVAVRSSATAEDLPDLSFAGQQDTYLNIIGESQLLEAVIDCWSSLWTARAIGYRMRNGINQSEAALAVVVQQMVASDASGVLFTANPLTGLLSEVVIDATFGLGEALVSGQVEPDHYVFDRLSQSVTSSRLGAKQVATRSKAGGGVETLQEPGRAQPALSEEQIRRLARLGEQVEQEYGHPQDIEWAFAGAELYLLQSRPITSLFPVPEVSFDPLKVWFSFGVVQGLMGPITPLGCDAIQHVVAGAGSMFGLQLRAEQVKLFARAGERIWVEISGMMRNPIGSRIFGGLLGFVEPSVGQILRSLAGEPRLGVGQGKLRFSTLRRLARFGLPVLARLAHNMLRPEQGLEAFNKAIETYLAAAHIPAGADRFERLANAAAFVRQRVGTVFAFLLPKFIPVFGPSMGALNLLKEIAGEEAGLALEVTRALPGNVTTTMDLALWATAQELRRDAASAEAFRFGEPAALARQYLAGSLPAVAQAGLARFLEQYGMRGVAEIDLGQPRWREDPTPVMHTLQSYLNIDPDQGPDVQFAQGTQAAREALERLASKARGQHGGWLKEKLVRAAAHRLRMLMGTRESPKFFAIRTMGVARQALLEVGKEFAAAGTLEQPDDLVYLKLAELEALARNEVQDWKALVAGRRLSYQRELRRLHAPRVLVSDGRAFYEGVGAATDNASTISGSPVSPGVVEGIVHVVRDPRRTQLAPGEIMVCPGTDPAWTPLFMTAGGLVTEVGGMMTHGSVVAREYGIPAVVGVHMATERLKNGQRVRVDGTTGTITLLS